jgi:homospermidine synthase
VSPKLVNQIIIIGFGNIAQASLPLIRATWKNSTIVAFEKFINPSHGKVADTYEVELRASCINEQNYESLLAPLLRHDTLLLNLATEVCSADLIRLAQARGAFYLDTCIDPWTYEHEKSGDLVTNYQLREELRELALQTRGLPTAIVAHGANPGFVSILVKKALEIMRDRYLPTHRAVPSSRHDWATLARDLGVRVIQISERDAQAALTTAKQVSLSARGR